MRGSSRAGGNIRSGSRPVLLAAVAAFLGLLLFLRHPEGLLDANLWAEDGWMWYPDAYNLGVRALVLPRGGYLQTFSRLIALASQPFPLLWAPTLFAVAAFVVRLLPPLLLLSRRFDGVWPNLPARLLMAAAYICLPNSFEGFANVTNSQWHLALAGFLLVTGAPAGTAAGRTLDLILLALCGLSGPFCLFLLPVAAESWLRSPSPHSRRLLACTLCCSLVQGTFLALTAVQARSPIPLGAGVVAFARVFANQVELGLVFGSNAGSGFVRSGVLQSGLAATLMAGSGLALCLAAAWRGPRVFRMFALFGALVLAASLATPVVTPGIPAWELLAMPGLGQRYFLIPMLVLYAAGVVLAGDRLPVLRVAGMSLCLAVLVGVAGDWSYPRMQATDFDSLARRFATSPAGTEAAFPLYPPGVDPMTLTKR